MSKKKKKRRKNKSTQRKTITQDPFRIDVAHKTFDRGVAHWENGKLDNALSCFKKAIKMKPPGFEGMLKVLQELGHEMERKDVILQAWGGLHRANSLGLEKYTTYINALMEEKQFTQALGIIKKYRVLLQKSSLPKKLLRKQVAETDEIERYCQYEINHIELKKKNSRIDRTATLKQQRPQQKKNKPVSEKKQAIPAQAPAQQKNSQPARPTAKPAPTAIPVTITVDTDSFTSALGQGETVQPQALQVTIDALRISFRNSFEQLICLPLLNNIKSFWYQEETVRKVLKTFHGRAMLADEVGLGKTVEAGMVLKEYIERGMVKNVLILTPTPLVSQWKEELDSKFGLDFISSDDPGVKINDEFWGNPFILTSINLAKSKKNFSTVTAREYDMVIVDEAHHLKNKNTLNWKLVNSLHKRFLLFLTATPVENNLMELYNLITLLKPGLLKTASAFKKEFMTQGDAVSPRNRTMLRGLLDQVMIRNTRALAALNIPPRFAQTVLITPDKNELQLYTMVTDLVTAINQHNKQQRKRTHRMLLKNLLAEAGSSPRAISLTMGRLLEKDDDRLADFHDQIQAIRTLCRSITGETGKNKALGKLINRTSGKKIIFVKYIGSMEEIADYLDWHNISYTTFHGSMSNQKKDAAIDQFRDEKDILLTTEIGGEGRNLQFCHQMINYDLPWNPMKIEQRIGRIHRMGQENEVMIYNFCGKGSLEEHILEILDKKINMFEMVIGEIDMILGRIRGEKDFEEMVYEIWVDSESKENRDREFAKLGTRVQRSKAQYGNTRELDENLFGDDYEL